MKKNKLIILFAALFLSGSAMAAEKWEIDKSHSEVGFSVKHMVITTVTGKFHEFDGTVMFDANDPTQSMVEGTVKVSSIDTGNERRDGHLKSADFFDAEKYPEITFKTKKIMKKGDGYVAISDLTMRGVTREVEMAFNILGKVDDPWGNTRVGLEASTTVKRLDYGISWNNKLDNGAVVVSDDVKIMINAQIMKKKA